MGISRPTVRKYLREEKYSGYSREGRVSIVSWYEDYIRDMINRYNLSAVRIYENIIGCPKLRQTTTSIICLLVSAG